MAVPATVTLYVREVHEVIDLIGTLFNRYYGLLTAAEMGSLVSGLEGTYAVPLTGLTIYSGWGTRPRRRRSRHAWKPQAPPPDTPLALPGLLF
jgi:hypothetical protein